MIPGKDKESRGSLTGNGEETKQYMIIGDVFTIALSLGELGSTSCTSEFVLLTGKGAQLLKFLAIGHATSVRT